MNETKMRATDTQPLKVIYPSDLLESSDQILRHDSRKIASLVQSIFNGKAL